MKCADDSRRCRSGDFDAVFFDGFWEKSDGPIERDLAGAWGSKQNLWKERFAAECKINSKREATTLSK
jgi:hypothetical protein